MLVGYRVKEARKKKGYNQEELGKLLGVSKVSICGYETGTRTPTMETFLDLIQILDLSPEYALGIETSVVEEDSTYGKRMSDVDFTILEELKRHPELYNELCKNPKRTAEIISRNLK